MEKVNVGEKFDLFSDYWSPKIAAELNDSYIKLAKLKGEFVWHHHEKEDELFFVMKGRLLIKLRDGEVRIGLENSWSSSVGLIICRWPKTRFTSS
jgi:mannose-6-phosphate isomerase-like protein (cupin superfamily)